METGNFNCRQTGILIVADHSDGEQFPLKTEVVDFIFSSEVIEHIYDTKNALKEMARVLKQGGRLLITTPYHGFLKNLIILFHGFDDHFNPVGPHVRFFTERSLGVCLKDVGLRIVKKGYFGRIYPIPHCFYVLAEK